MKLLKNPHKHFWIFLTIEIEITYFSSIPQGQKRPQPEERTAARPREAKGAPGAGRPEPGQAASRGKLHRQRARPGDNATRRPPRAEEPGGGGGRLRFPVRPPSRLDQPGVPERAGQTPRDSGRRRLLEIGSFFLRFKVDFS